MAFSDIGSQLAGRFTPRNLRCPMSFVIEIVAEFTPRFREGCARIGRLRQIGMNNETSWPHDGLRQPKDVRGRAARAT